jgi:poly(beta-D-mannuronate) C5 epimerase
MKTQTTPGRRTSTTFHRPVFAGLAVLERLIIAALLLLLWRTQGFAAFIETGGLVVVEAEHYESATALSGHAWIATNGVAGFVGMAAMRVVPNSGLTLSSVTNSPELTYLVQITNSGTFKLWVRVWGASGSDDSIYAAVDAGTPQTVSFGATGVWVWKSIQVTLASSGAHQIRIWMREDGAYVDRVLLARSPTYTPTGDGPPETAPPTTFRWVSASRRIYVEGGGSVSLSDIRAALPKAPLCLVDPTNRIWFLAATLIISDGVILRLHGSAAGGDVNELRLQSDNSAADGSCVVVDADWGTLDLLKVKIVSWDQLTASPDTEHALYKRAFIRARSRLAESGVQQSTLNVVDSEIGFLGVQSSDAYGLTWQVVGSAPDEVTVQGQVRNSYIHDSILGLADRFWTEVVWTNNNIVANTLFGFNPTAHNVVLSNSYNVALRWAGVSQRIYVTGPGEATLSDIKAAVPDSPLTLVDPANKVWHLGANLFVENGARLKLYGPAIGGDVAELRLKSDNTTTNAGEFVELRADWGWLDIRNTKITSWDSAVNGPDTETATYRRAYVRARSTLDPDGVTAHESRMDVIDSEISHLGSYNTEAYGLTWKVVDTTAIYLPPGSTKTLFDVVNVYGDILNSRIHHNYFGVYTYGHEGGRWANNEVSYNVAYGFDPHDDSDHLLIENNNVHHNGWHGIIASKRCDNGVLRNNVSWNNGLDLVNPHGHGIMLHRSCNDWVVEGNRSIGNPNAGIAIFASDRNLIRNNVCLGNTNAGIRLSVGSADNWVEGNEVGGAHQNGFLLFEGNDPPELDDDGGVGSGRCSGNVFTNNVVHDYVAEAIKLSNCDSNVFAGNAFIAGATTLRFEGGVDNLVAGNLVPANTFARLVGASTNRNRTTTTFLNQPRLTLMLDPFSTATFADDAGAIFDLGAFNVATFVDAAGSFVTLTSAQVGTGANTVLTRKFFAEPNTGAVLVNTTGWGLNGQMQKAWTAQASSSSMQVRYIVGDMRPGRRYDVRQGTTLVATATADAQGYISFTARPGSTAAWSYSVRH